MTCLNCQSEFEKVQNHQKYCSKKCKNSFQAKNRVFSEEEITANKLRARQAYVKKYYNMSWDEYLDFIAKDFCEICGKSSEENGRLLSVDHCHETNKVRGLLCDDCNKGLGFFKDDVEVMANAIHYLVGSALIW